MRIIASVAISIDGCLDDSSPKRLILSSPEDLEEVRKIRSECDAILVGAETIRKDNPSLVTSDRKFIERRKKEGRCADPIKVTITKSGHLPLDSNFFKKGKCPKIVYCSNSIPREKEKKLQEVATVVKLKNKIIASRQIVADLKRRGVRSLLIEGGNEILTMFFADNLVNEFRLAIAPFLVGEKNAPRLLHSGIFPFNRNRQMKLESVKRLGDTAVMRYTLFKR